MKLHHKSRQSGFTLIELLAVVAILGILAGIGIPRIFGAIENARLGADRANIAMLQSAVDRWSMDVNPANVGAWNPLTLGPVAPTAAGTFELETTAENELVPNYLLTIPTSPSGTAYSYGLILVDADGTGGSDRHTATVVRVPALPAP